MSNLQDIRPKKPTIELGGKSYTLWFDLNAFAEIEDEFGEIDVVMTKLTKGSAKTIRALVWAGLLCNENSPSLKEVGALLTFADMNMVSESLMKAIGASMPEPDPNSEKN